ncbi:MAG TPA: YidC/Oxa1 family membrane protein insertase [Acidimicrobiales bacterium]|nr:YidC/Oxa1 family membrane protein insertase [Acidimicrobiales bacterium]
MTHLLASALMLGTTLGKIFEPLFKALSYLLSFFYSLIPNYVAAITLLTLSVMIVAFPLNRASTRSMMAMQLLQPEMNDIRKKYKIDPKMSVAERQDARRAMQEETLALYREHNVSMTGGCLPQLVIMPIFIILYDTIRGLTNTCWAAAGKAACLVKQTGTLPKGAHQIWSPRYVITTSHLYANLKAAGGKMISLGLNLGSSVRTHQSSWVHVLPYAFLVAIAVGLQYVQLKQMSGRNTQMRSSSQAGSVPNQMQTMTKIMPIMMAFIYIFVPAAVVVYFIVSTLFRIGQQEWMFRRDPHVVASYHKLRHRKAEEEKSGSGKPKSTGQASKSTGTAKPSTGTKPTGGGATKSSTAAKSTGTAKSGSTAKGTSSNGTKAGSGRATAGSSSTGGSGGTTKKPAASSTARAAAEPLPAESPKRKSLRERLAEALVPPEAG